MNCSIHRRVVAGDWAIGVLVALTTAGCGAQRPIDGTYAGTPASCAQSCSRLTASECDASDCEEVPFRVFGQSGQFYEGGIVYSASRGSGSASWLLPDASYKVTGDGIVIASPPLPMRTIKFHMSGDSLVTGTGTVWNSATTGFAKAVATATAER